MIQCDLWMRYIHLSITLYEHSCKHSLWYEYKLESIMIEIENSTTGY